MIPVPLHPIRVGPPRTHTDPQSPQVWAWQPRSVPRPGGVAQSRGKVPGCRGHLWNKSSGQLAQEPGGCGQSWAPGTCCAGRSWAQAAQSRDAGLGNSPCEGARPAGWGGLGPRARCRTKDGEDNRISELGAGNKLARPPKPSQTPHPAALTARELSWREPLHRPCPGLLHPAPHAAFLHTPSLASPRHHPGVSKTRGVGPQEQCKPAPHPDVTPGLSPALSGPGLPTHTPAAMSAQEGTTAPGPAVDSCYRGPARTEGSPEAETLMRRRADARPSEGPRSQGGLAQEGSGGGQRSRRDRPPSD